MKRGSLGGSKEAEKKKKKPVTNSEKAEFFLSKLEQTISSQIEKGKIEINKNKRHINKSECKNSVQNRYEMSLQNIEQNLSLIRASIVQQKKGQQEAQKQKLIQAKEFINKMKKEKQQHKLRLRESEQRREMVYAKIFSDSAMEDMRKKLAERVETKKKEIEQRIKEKMSQRLEKQHSFVGQQIQYSEYLKGLKQKSKSSTKLPSILNPQAEQRNHSVLQIGRKNSLSSIKKYPSKSSKNIAFYIQKEIVKKESGRQLKFENGVQITKMKSNHKILLAKLDNQAIQSQENASFLANRPKIYGDQYLKESILKIKRQTEPDNAMNAEISLEVKSNEALMNKNEYLQNLKENWLRVLSRIQHAEISQQQGIDLLHSMEKKLDKIDSRGLTARLKKKLQVFAKCHQIPQSAEQKTTQIVQ